MPADHCQILPHRSVAPELFHQRVSILRGFCEEQNPGRVTIDAMYDEGSLSL